MDEQYLRIAKVFKSLSDPKRIQIIDILADGEKCASVLLEYFHVSQPTLSHDMKQLIEAGVVKSRREGQRIYYSINTEAIQRMQNRLVEILQAN